MNLSDLSIRRPVFTTMTSLALVVLGAIGLSRLGIDLFPDVQIPVAVVSTVYKGAGPRELESQVAKPIEDAVAAINGVDFIHSISRENVALVVVQFKLSADFDRSVQEVRDKVSAIQGLLPRDADQPKVMRFDVNSQPIVTYAASADVPTQEVRRLIEKRLEPALAQLEGVAEVRVTGGDVREVRVDVDLDAAKAAGTAPGAIAQQVGMENLTLPAGRLDLGPTELTVRSVGELSSVDDLRGLPVARSQSGAQVRLDEVATVTDGVADRRTVARLNGHDAVLMEIVKQPGSNTVLVAEQVKKRMAELVPSLGSGFKASVLIDQSTLIRENTKEVWIALLFGGLMAIVIILAFLLDLRGTFISSLALPTSVLGTFFVMSLLGYTLNQLTLIALSLAIGLLIDDAVVVREAITHRLELGQAPAIAASKGTQDVFLAVLATTLSLVAVFVPVAFMPGMVGKFFKQFGLTISAAVLVSLFISFTLDPMLSARLVKTRVPGEARQENAVARLLRSLFEATEAAYGRLLGWVVHHKAATLAVSLAAVGLVGFAGRSLKAEFIPAEDRGQFMVDLELRDGASLSDSTVVAAAAEGVFKKVPEVRDVYAVVGRDGDSNRVRFRVLLTEKGERARGVWAVKDELRPMLLEALPGTKVALVDLPPIEGAGDFLPIMLRVTGPDLAELRRQAEHVRDVMASIPGAVDVQLSTNPPKPELQIAIDRSRANDMDLTAAALAGQLRLALNGQEVGKLREGDDETPIVVRLSEKDRGTPEALQRLDVFSPRGVRPVSDVARVEMRDGPSLIERHNRERQLTVTCNIGSGAALGDVSAKLKEKLAKTPLPPGYAVLYDGQVKIFDEQIQAFVMVFVLAFVFVYMVLASQFESFKHPFTIVISVPLALVGAVLALVLTGHHLSMGAMIGVILLMGLVTKNAILLVDAALQNLRAGDPLELAVLKAGPRRLRPILMTSFAMAIAMVPTAIGTGVGSEFRQPMAISVIGGVITSTLLTLVVVPVVFILFEQLTPQRLRIGRNTIAEALDSDGKEAH